MSAEGGKLYSYKLYSEGHEGLGGEVFVMVFGLGHSHRRRMMMGRLNILTIKLFFLMTNSKAAVFHAINILGVCVCVCKIALPPPPFHISCPKELFFSFLLCSLSNPSHLLLFSPLLSSSPPALSRPIYTHL